MTSLIDKFTEPAVCVVCLKPYRKFLKSKRRPLARSFMGVRKAISTTCSSKCASKVRYERRIPSDYYNTPCKVCGLIYLSQKERTCRICLKARRENANSI